MNLTGWRSENSPWLSKSYPRLTSASVPPIRQEET